MLGFGLAAQKKIIPHVVDAMLPHFIESIRAIFVQAKVPVEKCNLVECAIFGFWSIRLGLMNTGAKMADIYAADYVLERCVKSWISAMAKATGQRPSGQATNQFYSMTKERYGEYHKTIENMAFHRSTNGNIDLPITEQTIHHFMRRVAVDMETLNAISAFGPYFSVALCEGQLAFANPMQPIIRGD